MSAPLVEVVRGELVEAVHRGHIAVVDVNGTMSAAVGDPETVTYWRSAAKPFQAMPAVYGGAASHWGLAAEDLALMSGSHNGEPIHVERVGALLQRLGRSVADLSCGVHPPLDSESATALTRAGEQPNILHNNCSANHTGMLALATQLQADVVGYEMSDHPAQQEIVRNVARFTDLEPADIPLGVDGCGAPCYGISVYRMALAYARLMRPEGLGEPAAGAARAVRNAMLAHPYLVAGRGRFDTDVMAAAGCRVLAKGGAGGVECLGLAEGVGVAVKVDDGTSGPSAGRPGSVAAIEVLRQLGVIDQAQVEALGEHARPRLRTLSGRDVGLARPVFTLEPAGCQSGEA